MGQPQFWQCHQKHGEGWASLPDPTGTYSFAYDNMGRLIGTTTQYSFLPSSPFTNAYTYDAASNRKSLTTPDGSITTYGYDTLNRLNGMANSWAGSFGFGYDALSRRTQLKRPNGINTNYAYDSVSRLLSVLHQAGSTTIDGASYLYDNAGNRTSKTNYLNNLTEGYTYDPVYQLTQVTKGGSTTESYTYDPVGNRLSSSSVPSYNYNSSNELTSNSNGSYTYDANGNTLTDAQGRSFIWDFENRMTQAVVPGTSGGTTAFKYDPFGRRIQKSGPLGTTNYLYDGANLIEELDNAGNVLARYTQGPVADEELTELRSGTTSYYEADGLGSITSLSNGAGTLANTYTYDSYGKLTASTGTITNPFQYTGREFDSETGIYEYRARYYDQNIGRFISEDPIGFKGGIDFYAYVKNNPINLFDPTGLAAQCKHCKIVVKCRGVQKYHLGLLGFQHCDAQVVDDNGITHSLSGGPDPATNGELLNFWNTTTNIPPFGGSTIYNNQNASCDTANCLINGANTFHNDPMHFAYIPYGGPNSNTALGGIFGGCGIHLNIDWAGPTGPGFSTMTPQ